MALRRHYLLWQLAAGDPERSGLLEAYRLRWDLADVEASVRDLPGIRMVGLPCYCIGVTPNSPASVLRPEGAAYCPAWPSVSIR